MQKKKLKEFLEREVKKRDTVSEISKSLPDPMLVAKRYKDEYVSFICALFSYGRASLIVNFLNSLDFYLIDKDENSIRRGIKSYYRFQNVKDVSEIFITIKRLKNIDSIESIFFSGYKTNKNVLDGISRVIRTIYKINSYSSRGYNFLIGKEPSISSSSPYKRWNMFLRWMVRKDNIDLGLWSSISKRDLIIPLDVHTFNVSRRLKLISRGSCDLKSALMLTEKLKEFDKEDPIKYDFALYRMGQTKFI